MKRFEASAELAAELQRALDREELVSYFQPQYDLVTLRVVALEALCRWPHPGRGLVQPDLFIPVAERHELIERLGRYMLEHSGRQARAWVRRGFPVGLAVNVSPSELRDGFADRVIAQLEALGLPATTVTLEITETLAMRESESERAALTRLIAAGVGVSIDDFGAGHTSLDGLRRVPFTEVKIDRALTQSPSSATAALVRAAVAIARDCGARVVAEGIETVEHLDRAREWGCDRGQGYHLAPPAPAEVIEPLLVAQSG